MSDTPASILTAPAPVPAPANNSGVIPVTTAPNGQSFGPAPTIPPVSGVVPASNSQLGPVVTPAAPPVTQTPPAQPAPAQPKPVNPAPAPSGQTFTFGNGKTYDQDGNLVQPNNPSDQTGTNAGNAGLSPTDFLSLLGSQTATNKQTLDQIYQQLGIPQAANSAFATLGQSTVDVYNQAYAAAGLGDVKQKISDLNQQIEEAQQQYTNATQQETENPFLSEAARTQRTEGLYNSAQETIGNLLNEQANYQNLYAQGINEANNLVSRYTNDFQLNTGQNQSKLAYLLQQAETQEGATQNTAVEQLIARYAPQYLQAYAQTSAAEKPFGSPQTGLYTYNPQTKSYTQVAPPAGTQTPITTPTGQVLGFNTNTGTVTNTGANTFTGGGSLGSFTSNPSTAGSFPTGAQQQPGSAASVNNVSGIKQNGQFVPYQSPVDSFNATVSDIQNKQNGQTGTGLNGNSSLNDFVNTWVNGNAATPATGYTANNVAQYLQQMGVSGITANTRIGQINPTQLATAVTHFETGYTPPQQNPSSGQATLAVQNTPSGQQPTVTPANPDDENVSSVMQAFQNLSANYSNPQQYALASATLGHYLGSGDVVGAWNYVQQQAVNQLSGSDRDNYNSFQTGLQQLKYAQTVLQQNPNLQTGVWSSLLQNAKKYFGVNQTQAYTQFSAAINQASTETMNALFGSRLTATEISKAAPFLVNDTDPVATAVNKISGEIGTLQYMSAQLVNKNQLGQSIPSLTEFISLANGQIPGQ